MSAVLRYDSSPLGKPKRQANGWLRVDGFLTRTGVFRYMNADGTERRELRLPEEVFHPDALKSFDMVPITHPHPPFKLDASNTRDYQRGTTTGVRQDGHRVRGDLLVTDADVIKAMEAGVNQLSCGYECTLENAPGIYQGERYDSIQRNIRGNHVAVVTVGRAGPDCAARMDADDAADSIALHGVDTAITLTTSATDAGAQPARSSVIMDETIVKFDGALELKVPVAVAKAIESERAAAKAALDKAAARADAADAAQVASAKQVEAVKASLPALVSARVALEVEARKHLGEVKADASDRDVKLAVLAKLGTAVPADKLTSDAYVDAAFDIATAAEAKKNPSLAAALGAAVNADASGSTGATDEKSARARMAAHNASLYTTLKGKE